MIISTKNITDSLLGNDKNGIFLRLDEFDEDIILSIFFIDASHRGAGIGSRIIEELKLYADSVNKIILATPARMGKYFENMGIDTPISQIDDFYKKRMFRNTTKSEFSKYQHRLIYIPSQYGNTDRQL